MDETVVYPPRVKLMAFAVGCVGVAGLGLAMAAAAAPVLAVAGGLLGVATAAAAGVFVWRALRPGPTLRVGAEGIVDRTGLSPTGLVRWEEIAAIRKREIGRGRGAERMLEIVLVDPRGFAQRPRTVARRIADRYRSAIRQPQVAIAQSMVTWSMDEIIDEVLRWRPELPVHELPPPLPGWVRRRPQPPRW